MGLIRQTDSVPLSRRPVSVNLADVEQEGASIVARALAEAVDILEQARQKRDVIIAGADERGYASGLERGLAEGRRIGADEGRAAAIASTQRDLERVRTEWLRVINDIDTDRDRRNVDAIDHIVRLAGEIASHAVRRTLTLEPSIVVDHVRAAVDMLSKASSVVIVANPEDAALLRDALPSVAARFAAGACDIREDAAYQRGTCCVESDAGGQVMASIRDHAATIASALLSDSGSRA